MSQTGTIRKDVYAIVEEILGREITDKEHDRLKKEMVRFTMLNIPSMVKLERIYTCRKCNEKESVTKKQDKRRHHSRVANVEDVDKKTSP